ncbi:CNNM domain-containing protein [Mycolicibacterium litorale]|uniref:Membrane protein n=1 Tax=Mycolicibacterium litorale TaxID=758802 RepID=A0AAD1IIS7_9MYCO|nr:hemolysin family protein [Mycolicibacterium litorale]MCV7413712.1 HlyC/CorC family transporter [Mycolicibacterium litorale]TDY03406.1 CBS domain containing-hemolysin-like protein [Mycolicibacterium litorale]BBY15203.1 membrane protein [Mycolicibacterium litorale]
MSSPWVVAAITVALIGMSAFFVAVEFALIAARRNRLEDAAATSAAARAALRSAGELSVLLAGAQLGITVCTLMLGAVTKPAVHHAITPLLGDLGAPTWAADAGGFVLALVIVTFLHLVVGEMAPKSWAIAHPERSATLLAMPMRAFMFVTRPLLRGLNQVANWCLRRVGVIPVDELADTQDPDALRQLVEHSATVGTLDERYHANLTSALELEALTVGQVARRSADHSYVRADATPAEIQRTAHATGHLRLLVRDGATTVGVVHVRDSLPGSGTARTLMRPVLTMAEETPVYEALRTMRETRSHLVVVDGAGGRGLLTLTDLLHRLLPGEAASHA